jgi:hypothetical protein
MVSPSQACPSGGISAPLSLEDSIPPVVNSPKVTLVTPEMKHPMRTATPTVSAPPHLAPADGVAWVEDGVRHLVIVRDRVKMDNE